MDPKDCYRRWANINALIARHCRLKGLPHSSPDVQYGVSVVSAALEQSYIPPQISGDDNLPKLATLEVGVIPRALVLVLVQYWHGLDEFALT